MIYCRPDANSLTAQRARDGEAKLRQEVCDLCDIIFNLGVTTNEGRSKIQFGELFQVTKLLDGNQQYHKLLYMLLNF